MICLRYYILLFNLGCFIFGSSDADCIEFIAEKHQREGIMAKLTPITADACVEVCEHINTCYAVNYFRLNVTCELLNQTMPESKLIKATKCFYKAVRSPPQESTENDPCYKKTCPWDEICMHNKTTNSAECYPLCTNPRARSGTIHDRTELEVGQNYTYKCQAGLLPKTGQNPTVTCLPDGSWTSTNFTCVCPTPPARSGTINSTTEVEVGDNYIYKYHARLVAKEVQDATVTCLPYGGWTSTNFICVCTPPPARSRTINGRTEIEVGQNYTYKCQAGLVAKAGQNPIITCLPDGSWTSTNFTCVCTPPSKSGTITEVEEVEVGQNYTYQCLDGLFEKGDLKPTITCLENGSWTSTNFECVKQNWKQDTIYPNNIHKSDVISNVTGIDLLACMKECDDKEDNCLSFFYNNNTSQCVLSSSFRRGLPQYVQSSDGWVYYTAPSYSCDMGYMNVSFGGSYFCVKLHQMPKTFNEAMRICETERAKLLVVQQRAYLNTFQLTAWTYIGIWDVTKEGQWISWDGETVKPIWTPGEPNGGTNENCGIVKGDWIGIVDGPCNGLYHFLCNKK